jgi:hypothetical protein
VKAEWETRIHDPKELNVFRALADPRWDFRTIHGISGSTGISTSEVAHILVKYQDVVRQSPIPDRQGRQLFTLRSRRPKRQELIAEIRSFVTKSIS